MSPIMMRKPKAGTYSWIMESIDKKLLTEQVSIVLEDYEKNQNRYHAGPLENLLGIVAEYSFDGFLEQMRLTKNEYEWHKRTFNHQADKRPWDFCIANEITIEIGAARPTHKFAILKKASYKVQSRYFVQVQIEYLRCVGKAFWNGKERRFLLDARNPHAIELTDQNQIEQLEQDEKNDFALATIKGFDETDIIRNERNEWKLGLKGQYPTYDADGWFKPLNELRTPGELKDIIRDTTGYD